MALTATEMVALIDEAIEDRVKGSTVFKASHAGSSLENMTLDELNKMRAKYKAEIVADAGAGIQLTRFIYGKVTDG